MELVELVAQLIGLVAMVIAVSSFQVKSQKGIVSVLIISTSLWTLHYLLKGLYVGALLNLICAIRSVIYSKRSTHKWAASTVWIYVFTALSFVVYALQFTVFGTERTAGNFILQLLPVIGVFATSIGFRSKTGFGVRASQLVSGPVWLIYNIIGKSIGGAVTEVIATASVVVGIIRHDLKDIKKQRENAKKQKTKT